jgi:hypothetical protein
VVTPAVVADLAENKFAGITNYAFRTPVTPDIYPSGWRVKAENSRPYEKGLGQSVTDSGLGWRISELEFYPDSNCGGFGGQRLVGTPISNGANSKTAMLAFDGNTSTSWTGKFPYQEVQDASNEEGFTHGGMTAYERKKKKLYDGCMNKLLKDKRFATLAMQSVRANDTLQNDAVGGFLTSFCDGEGSSLGLFLKKPNIVRSFRIKKFRPLVTVRQNVTTCENVTTPTGAATRRMLLGDDSVADNELVDDYDQMMSENEMEEHSALRLLTADDDDNSTNTTLVCNTTEMDVQVFQDEVGDKYTPQEMSMQFWLLGKWHTAWRYNYESVADEICVNHYVPDINQVMIRELNAATIRNLAYGDDVSGASNIGLPKLHGAKDQYNGVDADETLHTVRESGRLLMTFDREIKIGHGHVEVTYYDSNNIVDNSTENVTLHGTTFLMQLVEDKEHKIHPSSQYTCRNDTNHTLA